MIITKTPFRISLFGGGTDFRKFFENHPDGGAVIGFALDAYCWITLRRLPPFFDYRHRIVYSKVEQINDIEEVQHPVIRCVLKDLFLKIENVGFELHHDGDLPARAGLGSSSSFTVGLINAVGILQGARPKPTTLAAAAIGIERYTLGEPGGEQDQMWAAWGGGPARINFRKGMKYDRPLPLVMTPSRIKELLNHLMLFFTGFQRDAPDIEANKIACIADNEKLFIKIRRSVDEAQRILEGAGDIRAIGELFDEMWVYKAVLAPGVAPMRVDNLYRQALKAGAIGGKICGAGGGGFLLLFVPPEQKAPVRAALRGLVEVPIGIAPKGSEVVVST